MKNKTTIEIVFFILSLTIVFYFITSIIIALYSNNWDFGMFSFVIFLCGAAILFFLGNIFESLEQKINQE